MSQRPNGQPDRGRAVSFWLAHEDIRALKTIAQEKGIGHTTLVRMWVKDKLKELQPRDRTRGSDWPV